MNIWNIMLTSTLPLSPENCCCVMQSTMHRDGKYFYPERLFDRPVVAGLSEKQFCHFEKMFIPIPCPCHMSRVACHMSNFLPFLFLFFSSKPSGGDSGLILNSYFFSSLVLFQYFCFNQKPSHNNQDWDMRVRQLYRPIRQISALIELFLLNALYDCTSSALTSHQ